MSVVNHTLIIAFFVLLVSNVVFVLTGLYALSCVSLSLFIVDLAAIIWRVSPTKDRDLGPSEGAKL